MKCLASKAVTEFLRSAFFDKHIKTLTEVLSNRIMNRFNLQRLAKPI